MTWGNDGVCPFPYQSSYVENQPTCVFSPSGLSDTPYTEEQWNEIMFGAGPIPGATVQAPRSMGSMNISAGLTPGQKAQPFDYTWIMIAAGALFVFMFLGNKRR